jgi:hypothetical protein
VFLNKWRDQLFESSVQIFQGLKIVIAFIIHDTSKTKCLSSLNFCSIPWKIVYNSLSVLLKFYSNKICRIRDIACFVCVKFLLSLSVIVVVFLLALRTLLPRIVYLVLCTCYREATGKRFQARADFCALSGLKIVYLYCSGFQGVRTC